ncbi:MAG: acyl-CoA dehydrogenase family protein [Actinomycetota bacterium]
MRAFVEAECPIGGIRELAQTPNGFDPTLWRRGGDLGLLSVSIPQQDGGLGQGIAATCAVAEEVGRGLLPGPFASTIVAAHVLAAAGSREQRREVLPAILAGDQIVTVALCDDTGPYKPISAVAENAGGSYVLNGSTCPAEHADVADWLLVVARVDERRLVQFLVPRNAGITITPHPTLDLTRRLFVVSFDGVAVQADALVGDIGVATIERAIDIASVLVAAGSVGGATRVLEMSTTHARERVQFGRAIGSFQAVKHKCANMLIALEGCRAATSHAATALDNGASGASLAASSAKSFVGDAYPRIAGDALQIHGGMGFTWELDVHLYLRRAKADHAIFGTPRWHRERLCRLLGLATTRGPRSGSAPR